MGQSKGTYFFQNYHNRSPKPWFYNKNIDREVVTLINRVRSNHYNLKESLFKIKVVSDPLCECGHFNEDLNHVLWQCQIYDHQRIKLQNNMVKCKLNFPIDIRNLLVKPNLKVIKHIVNFLNDCNLRI